MSRKAKKKTCKYTDIPEKLKKIMKKTDFVRNPLLLVWSFFYPLLYYWRLCLAFWQPSLMSSMTTSALPFKPSACKNL